MSAKVVEGKKKGNHEPPRGLARPAAKGIVSGVVRGRGKAYRPRPYPYEVRRRAVQLHLEEGIAAKIISRELGVTDTAVYDWTQRYRKYGEQGLRYGGVRGGGKAKLPGAVHKKITELKQQDPRQGARRISQILRRFFCLKASPETVRQHLNETGLTAPKPKARKKPTPPPRRFERSTPNQMWQSDITYFPILGQTAYIIGFLDDYSRYITGLGVYRSQPSAYVVEIYREAAAAYGAPKEMLTDNGRQYASWRGTTKFQQELKRDHVHHIRSSPQHPMTLGKIERFWKTLKEEFLMRARFETFEEARERIGYWVKHYNHRRVHQSLEGMCPADRYFSIQNELREAIERGVAANVEELALRGKPVEPFYLVGRMGDQSVVIETDKKRMSVRVDGKTLDADQPLVYELEKGAGYETGTDNGNQGTQTGVSGAQRQGEGGGGTGGVERAAQSIGAHERTGSAVVGDQPVGEAGALRHVERTRSDLETGRGGSAEPAPAGGEVDRKDVEAGGTGRSGGGELNTGEDHHENSGSGSIRGHGEMPGGTGGVDGTQAGLGAVPGDGDERIAAIPVAGPGAFGYAGGVGAAGYEGGNRGPGVARAGEAVAGSQGAGTGTGEHGPERQLADAHGARKSAGDDAPDRRSLLTGEVRGGERTGGNESAGTSAVDPGGAGRAAECHAGGAGTGGESQDVLRMAESGADGDARGLAGSAGREACATGGSTEGTPAGHGGYSGEGAVGSGKSAADPAGHTGNAGQSAAGNAAA